DCAKISAHPFEHDLAIDVHHVGVADPMMVHDPRYFRARAEFARLALHCENGNLRARQIFEDCFRHELERPPGVVLEYEQAVIRTNALYFSLQGRGYVACGTRFYSQIAGSMSFLTCAAASEMRPIIRFAIALAMLAIGLPWASAEQQPSSSFQVPKNDLAKAQALASQLAALSPRVDP